MTKSQNTKNEQLTEKWKKGELPEGFYYVNDGAEVKIDYYLCGYWEWHFNSDIKQVLAPVPSYEKWQAVNQNMDSIMQTNQALCKKLSELKELLKDAKNVLKMVDTYYGDYDSTKGFLIVERIDEALR